MIEDVQIRLAALRTLLENEANSRLPQDFHDQYANGRATLAAELLQILDGPAPLTDQQFDDMIAETRTKASKAVADGVDAKIQKPWTPYHESDCPQDDPASFTRLCGD